VTFRYYGMQRLRSCKNSSESLRAGSQLAFIADKASDGQH
jgi:hypothetical protein